MPHQRRINIKSHTILSLLLFAFCLSLCFGTVKMTAYADNGDFNIDAQLLSSGGETFDISVTVENMGDDWEGVARLKLEGNRGLYHNCAYDTAISLPQGSVKQFLVKVPKHIYNADIVSGTVAIFMVDKNSNPICSKKFDNLLFSLKDTINMGILSDDYSSLTFMDMGGDKLNYYNTREYPIKLVELNQDNLSDLLESLEILVIDKYDTGILTSDEAIAITSWNRAGGVLIVGTGKYAKDTLAGLDYYLDAKYIKMYDAEDVPYDGLSLFNTDELEFAELDYLDSLSGTEYTANRIYDVDDLTAALITHISDGAIGVLPYSLSELGRLGDDAYKDYATQSDFAYQLLDVISANAKIRFSNPTVVTNYNIAAGINRYLDVIGYDGSALNFGALKLIIIIYVILAGPVLYLVLRFLKKRDLYWAAVPALSFMGIIIVMFAGKGFEIARTKVYSVTVCDVSEPDDYDCMTYMHCYDAHYDEWKLRLSQGYKYVSPTFAYSDADDAGYSSHILKEGERLFFGINPDSGFEDAYFYASKYEDMQSIGGIECDLSSDNASYNTIVHKVANNTEHDFEYIAVIDKNLLWVYDGLAAGDACNPAEMKAIFLMNMDKYYYSDYIKEARDKLNDDNMDSIAALGIGINSAYSSLKTADIAVICVASDYIKAVDDNCSEEAYGCFYIVQ